MAPTQKKATTAKTVTATINLHRRLYNVPYKKRAPRALREIKAFAQSNLVSSKVIVDPSVNIHVWGRGIRSVPNRVRLNLSRTQSKDRKGNRIWVTTVTVENVSSFKGLETKTAGVSTADTEATVDQE